MRHRQPRRSTTSNSSATTLADIAAEKAGIAKPGVPLVTQPIRRSRAAWRDRAAHAPLAAARRRWDARVRGGSSAIATIGALDLPLPALPGRAPGAQCQRSPWRCSRHQDGAGGAASTHSARRSARRDWPARLQQLGAGPLIGGCAKLWLDGGHNPRPRADRDSPSDARRRRAAAPRSSPASRPRIPPACSHRSRRWSPHVACRAHSRPRLLRARAISPRSRSRARLRADAASTSVDEALGAHPDGARVLIFGSLYLAGEVLAANGEVPD